MTNIIHPRQENSIMSKHTPEALERFLERVGTFTWDGHTIANPFMDETVRFPVTPAYYGFAMIFTGGGCEAWVRDEEGPGVELWVTDLDAQAATCDCRGWIIGLYYMGSDGQEPIWSVTVPVDGERIIDIADPDPRPLVEEEPDANARLIAAAPELLEAAQLVLASMADEVIGHTAQMALEAAIGKAVVGTVKEVLPSPNPLTCDDPKCTSERFTATAQVAMNYLLDGDGDWVEDRGESETRDVDYDSLICDVCGEEATLR